MPKALSTLKILVVAAIAGVITGKGHKDVVVKDEVCRSSVAMTSLDEVPRGSVASVASTEATPSSTEHKKKKEAKGRYNDDDMKRSLGLAFCLVAFSFLTKKNPSEAPGDGNDQLPDFESGDPKPDAGMIATIAAVQEARASGLQEHSDTRGLDRDTTMIGSKVGIVEKASDVKIEPEVMDGLVMTSTGEQAPAFDRALEGLSRKEDRARQLTDSTSTPENSPVHSDPEEEWRGLNSDEEKVSTVGTVDAQPEKRDWSKEVLYRACSKLRINDRIHPCIDYLVPPNLILLLVELLECDTSRASAFDRDGNHYLLHEFRVHLPTTPTERKSFCRGLSSLCIPLSSNSLEMLHQCQLISEHEYGVAVPMINDGAKAQLRIYNVAFTHHYPGLGTHHLVTGETINWGDEHEKRQKIIDNYRAKEAAFAKDLANDAKASGGDSPPAPCEAEEGWQKLNSEEEKVVAVVSVEAQAEKENGWCGEIIKCWAIDLGDVTHLRLLVTPSYMSSVDEWYKEVKLQSAVIGDDMRDCYGEALNTRLDSLQGKDIKSFYGMLHPHPFSSGNLSKLIPDDVLEALRRNGNDELKPCWVCLHNFTDSKEMYFPDGYDLITRKKVIGKELEAEFELSRSEWQAKMDAKALERNRQAALSRDPDSSPTHRVTLSDDRMPS